MPDPGPDAAVNVLVKGTVILPPTTIPPGPTLIPTPLIVEALPSIVKVRDPRITALGVAGSINPVYGCPAIVTSNTGVGFVAGAAENAIVLVPTTSPSEYAVMRIPLIVTALPPTVRV